MTKLKTLHERAIYLDCRSLEALVVVLRRSPEALERALVDAICAGEGHVGTTQEHGVTVHAVSFWRHDWFELSTLPVVERYCGIKDVLLAARRVRGELSDEEEARFADVLDMYRSRMTASERARVEG